jgi:hypothetical protein
MRLFELAAFALLMCTAPAQTQHLTEKRTTAGGNLVTIYSIAWPTPVSPVSADVEVCAGRECASLHIRVSLVLSTSLRRWRSHRTIRLEETAYA